MYMVLCITYLNLFVPGMYGHNVCLTPKHQTDSLYNSSSLCVSLPLCISVFIFLYPSPSVCLCVSLRAVEVKRKAVQRIEEQLMKLQVQATDREENKQIALGTSKLNYLDPRISVAWYLCGSAEAVYLCFYQLLTII